MDCFYAAIEERDNPSLRGKPVGVGGRSMRGVLTTANYEARKFGCHSAMPVFMAKEKCPQLIIVPTRFEIYRRDSAHIREIFSRYTDLVEPLSLDEAFLDVSHLDSPATHIAQEIRELIYQETKLTASAGISNSKLIAKIASDWKKPNGQFTVPPEKVADFMENLPLRKIPGVGKKMSAKLLKLGVQSCGEYRARDKYSWVSQLGGSGAELWERCWGRDERAVNPSSPRKSLSIENTFSDNIDSIDTLLNRLEEMLDKLEGKLEQKADDRQIRSLVIKLKFSDFRRTTAERAHPAVDRSIFHDLLKEAFSRSDRDQEKCRLAGSIRARFGVETTFLL